jgi:hypothetical protein
MENAASSVDASTRHRIDYERDLIENAIAMVAAGGSRRVTVASIRFGEELLAEAASLARGRGVRIRPLWGLGDGACDIVVEADD